MTQRIVMTGRQYSRLTVVEELGRKVKCVCDCGVEVEVYRSNVLAGYTQSCGCLQRERTSYANTTHGLAGTPIYTIWRAMLTRCYNPNHRAYPWYGGKGIKVCDRWQTFDNFAVDMAEGYQPGYTLDRKESAKDYSPENCRWLTKSENSRRGAGRGKEL